MKRAIILALWAMVYGGCAIPMPIPHPKTTAYRTRGKVVDSETGMPVGGAKLCYEGRSNLVFFTNERGSFDIPVQHDLVLVSFVTPCPVIDFPRPHNMPSVIIISKEGFRTQKVLLLPYYEQKLRERSGPRFIVELGELKMVADEPANQ